jgi:hypothetical protein
VNAKQATAILASRGMPSISVVRLPTGATHVRCDHCGAVADLTDADDVDARVRAHWRELCAVTAPFHRKEEAAT